MEFENVTTNDAVTIYKATNAIFRGIIKEIRELSKKKPDATLSLGKVNIVNRVLSDLKSALENEPEGKFLDLLEDQELPQTSDAVLVMVQYETALTAFKNRYVQKVDWGYDEYEYEWITPELISKYTAKMKKQKEERQSYLDEEEYDN